MMKNIFFKNYKNFTILNTVVSKNKTYKSLFEDGVDYSNTNLRGTNNFERIEKKFSALGDKNEEKLKEHTYIDKSAILSLTKERKNLFNKLNYPFVEHFQYKIFNIIYKNQNINYLCTDKPRYEVIYSALFLSLVNNKPGLYIIVEKDEDALNLIKVANFMNADFIYIKDKSQLELSHSKITSNFIINLQFLMNEEGDSKFITSILKETGHFVFHEINDVKKFLDWTKKNSIKRIMDNCKKVFIHSDKNKNLQIINGLNSQKMFYTVTVTSEEAEKMRNLGVIHYGMCVNERTIDLIVIENVKKYLGQEKEILIICETEDNRNELISKLLSKEGLNVDNIKKLEIKTNKEIIDYINPVGFDVVIEYPFDSPKTFLQRKRFLKKNSWDFSEMISLFYPYNLTDIAEMRSTNLLKMKVINLLSASWLLNTEDTNNSENDTEKLITSDKKNSEITKNSTPPLDFYAKLDNFLKEEEAIHSNNKDFFNSLDMNALYDKVNKNPTLLKKILLKFFTQNYSHFFNRQHEVISLTTGEPGFYTVKITPVTTKQLEERFHVVKFLIKQGICNSSDFYSKVYRVHESFETAVDIPFERYEEFKNVAESQNLKVEILRELPILFQSKAVEMLNKI
jgi:hypothetical protein